MNIESIKEEKDKIEVITPGTIYLIRKTIPAEIYFGRKIRQRRKDVF